MKKLLYITDQDEYVDHSFIAPLFEVYLKKYMDIDIIYFSDFKSDFESKDRASFTMPSCDKKVLVQTLKDNGLGLYRYDFVMVRNDIEAMKEILAHRKTYGYKALYRFSYPKSNFKLHSDNIKKKNTFFAPFRHHFQIQNEMAIINDCDIFLPTSSTMHKTFRPDVNIPTIICPPAINPDMLYPNAQHEADEKRFFYAGTIDKTRSFETLLKAFKQVKSKAWRLSIATRDIKYLEKILKKYPTLQTHIDIHTASTKEELLELIAKADIGVALLPDIPIYNSSLPVKIFNYYASAVPCLMTRSLYTDSIFSDCENAWFCDFSVEKIAKKITYLIGQSKADVMEIGAKGQAHLLETRNYKTIAQTIAEQLEGM